MATNSAPFPTPGESPYGDKVQDYVDTGDAAVEAAAVAAAEADAEAKVSAHESAANPHDQYLQKTPISIGTGVDLDTLTSPGLYQRSTSVGNEGLNYPIDDFAGYVTVWAGANYVRQEANFQTTSGRYGTARWERTKTGSNPFTPWVRTDPQTIWGTGNPNGVHSALTGAIFRNTEAGGWNGARVWRKDAGTSTTGWVVESGDTGWRDVSTLLVPDHLVPGSSAPRCVIARRGDVVEFAGRFNPAPARVGTNRAQPFLGLTLPSGFYIDQRTSYNIHGTGTGWGGNVLFAVNIATGGRLDLSYDSGVSGTALETDAMNIRASWSTSSAWPTTLPGTPA